MALTSDADFFRRHLGGQARVCRCSECDGDVKLSCLLHLLSLGVKFAAAKQCDDNEETLFLVLSWARLTKRIGVLERMVLI